ncbi:hypothetical protein [Rhizobium lentis]|uniref:hypothetical protein n=1 Tax=Rhizobium lentis TaxID=1138194 RepID=UPI001C82AF48|nr:hypothetical protein [Rhizobium lentis]MBX5015931.1 hypothetical protein [Rhizobium lentis]
MSIELGNWVLPLGVTVVAFGFAFASVKIGDIAFFSRTVNMIFNMLIVSLAAVASLSTWLAWALVTR